MYSRKGGEPKMGPRRTGLITRSCEDVLSTTRRNSVLLNNYEKRLKTSPEFCEDLYFPPKLAKRTSMLNPIKSLRYFNCYRTSHVKSLAVISATISKDPRLN